MIRGRESKGRKRIYKACLGKMQLYSKPAIAGKNGGG